MNHNEIPVVRLTVEQMKHQILHYLPGFHEQIRDQVEAEIESALANYDFGAEVESAVHEALNNGLKRYFGFGGDGHKAIQEAVNVLLNGKEDE